MGAAHGPGIFIFAFLTLLNEWPTIEPAADKRAISTSVAMIIAGGCLFGATGALMLTLIAASRSWAKCRSGINGLLLHSSHHLLGALICLNFFDWTGTAITSQLAVTPLLVITTVTLVYYWVTSLVIAGVMYWDSDQPVHSVWYKQFRQLWPHYIGIGIMAYLLAWGYLSNGIIGVLIFAALLFVWWISQNHDLRQTESLIAQLRTADAARTEHSAKIVAMHEELIVALSSASDLRDPYVHGHALQVMRYAVLIAKELGLPAERIQKLQDAGLLHDIGKIGIPEAILFKPAKLTQTESVLMKQHAVLGAALVQKMPSLQHLAPLIRYHHEHYNGQGYPSRLAGEAIPLEARILSVADAVEVMASDRPYRKALTPSAIRKELQKYAGTQFDPVVVAAFMKVMQTQGEDLIVNSATAILQIIENGAEFPPLETSETGEDIVGDEPVGTIFSSELDSINMALHKAVAVQRRMELSAQEGRELAETLLRVASTINTTLEQDRVLALILDQLAHVVQYDNASIMLLEEESLNSVARRSIHLPESQFMSSVRTDVLAHVREVLENKRAVVITDTHNDSRWMRRQGSENIRCWLGVPLLVQDRVIGLLNLSNSIPGSYTDHHVQVSVAFAAHASIAIENARLYTQAQQEIEERERAQAALRQSEAHLQERVIELQRAKAAEQKQRELAETLSEAARSMSASLQIQEVVHTIIVYLSRLVASDRIHVKLLHDGKVELFAYFDRPTNAYNYRDGQFPLYPLEARVTKQATPCVVKDMHEHSAWDLTASEQGLRSWLSVPLTVQDKVVGLLTLAKEEANFYTKHDVSLVGAFANQSAITVTNARLYQQLQNELAERMRAERALQEERGLLAQRVEERTFELKAANNKLTAALRTKDEFLATVSHELRTPLSAILLLTESMQKGVYGALSNRHSDVLSTVKQSARHLLALINDILDMSKIESGMFELDMGPVSLPIICRNSLQLVEEAAYKKQITLVYNIDPSIEHVNGDERRLLQILVNLLSNAMKFTPEAGKVGLEVVGDLQNHLAHLTIWDTGIGIAKEDISKLFQPFVQLDSKLSRQYEGTGLGLALVARLTQMHGGTVALTSEVGVGSRFTVSIPWEPQPGDPVSFKRSSAGQLSAAAKTPESFTPTANAPKAAMDAKLEGAQEPDQPQRDTNGNQELPLILLVEDNEIGIEAMQDYLMAYDYRVIVARSGEEAITQTNQHHPDLILMDVQMPDMDGLEATTRIRAVQELAHIPIIALTALAMPGDRERCIKAGANEYLSKPVSMKQLVQVIQTQLEQSAVHAF